MKRFVVRDVQPKRDVVKATPESAMEVRLPSATIEFLVGTGVPRELGWIRFGFDRKGMQRIVHAGPALPSGCPAIGTAYYVIGDYHSVAAVGLEERTGVMVLLPEEPWRKSGFINSSIQQFAQCIAYQEAFLDQWNDDEMPDVVPEETVQEFIAGIRAIDSAALSDEESWWDLEVRRLRGDLW